MDVILDSNIYYADFQMKGIAFRNLFDYLKRTSSTLVLLGMVRDEVVEKYTIELEKRANAAARSWGSLKGITFEQTLQPFPHPAVEIEKKSLRNRLSAPGLGTRVHVYECADVSVGEVFRRGVHRIRPADSNGEELRDVIIWLSALRYAETSLAGVAFISQDLGFWDGDAVHADILEDIKESPGSINLYRNIETFIEANSPFATEVSAESAEALIGFSDLAEGVVESARTALSRQGLPFPTTIQSGSVVTHSFVSGKSYEVAPSVQFFEITFHCNVILRISSGVPFGMKMWTDTKVELERTNQPVIFTSWGLGGGDQLWNQTDVSMPMYGSELQVDGIVNVSARMSNGRLLESEVGDFIILGAELPASRSGK